MDEIVAKERALHTRAIRQSGERLGELLDAEFVEIGESGTTYNREAVIKLLSSEPAPAFEIHSQDYKCSELAPDVVLLTYKTVRLQAEGGSHVGFAKRSSIWVKSNGEWKMRFHQGTACDAFELRAP